MKKLKVALVHDYIKEYGGAERVLETLHEMFPEAPVYTSVYLPRFLGPHRARLSDWDIRTSWAQRIPFVHKLISPLRLVSPWIFSSFDLSDFDVVIVSATGAYEPNMVRTKKEGPASAKSFGEAKGAVQICYCHTPPRYLYGYATARDWKKNKVMLVAGAIMSHFLRMVDFSAAQRVDYFVANSEEVAGRILKFYRKKAAVIYPPVELSKEIKNQKLKIKNQKGGGYFLTGGRLARAKHVDLIVRACIELGVPLKVFGRGFAGYEEELKKLVRSPSGRDPYASQSEAQDDVQFVGEVSDEEKAELMSNAKAFIFAGEDEDFGITPIEAMSFGLPVIAYRSGGVKETVIDGVTGVFFTQLRVESLKRALRDFERMRIDPEECIEQSKQFSKERFVKEFGIFLDKVL